MNIFSDSLSANQSISAYNTDFNNPAYQLEPEKDSNIYLFKEGLFKWLLLPIEEGKPRLISYKYTI